MGFDIASVHISGGTALCINLEPDGFEWIEIVGLSEACHKVIFILFESQRVRSRKYPPQSPVWATTDYDRRRRNIANPPKPIARSEKAEGSGTEEGT